MDRGHTPSMAGVKGIGDGSFHITVTLSDGSRYQGDSLDDKFHGEGVMHYANGDRYEDEFQHGMRRGKGTMAYADGSSYKGDWFEDKFHGQGVLNYNNGDRYEGEFRHHKLCGKGTMTYADGASYDDKYHGGKGVSTTAHQQHLPVIPWQSKQLHQTARTHL